MTSLHHPRSAVRRSRRALAAAALIATMLAAMTPIARQSLDHTPGLMPGLSPVMTASPPTA